MRVLFATSEIATLYKRGGLADVSYSLPVALEKQGVRVSIAMPYYHSTAAHNVKCVGQLAIDFDRRRELVFIFRTTLPHSHVRVYLFRHPILNDYDDAHIVDRFAFFSKAVSQLMLYSQEMLGGPYDIIHCHDWHTALIPMLLGEQSKLFGFRERETIQSSTVKTVLTIHNLLYTGETGIDIALKLGLPKSLFHAFTTPLGRAVRLMTEGLEFADVVTTVSPTYASEIHKGLHGKKIVETFARRKDRIVGILNGLDISLWNPKTDPALPEHYSASTVQTKKPQLKAHIQKSVRLPAVGVPLFGFVGRFEYRQKGLDLIARAIQVLPKDTYQMVLLGTGNDRLVSHFEHLAHTHENIAFINTFDERLARRIYAGSDIMLVPSKFEPCGLTQLIAMRYGTPPLVRKTGGLADTVTDETTGFVFERYTTSELIDAMKRAISMYTNRPKTFAHLSKQTMKQNFSWNHQVKSYIELYNKLNS